MSAFPACDLTFEQWFEKYRHTLRTKYFSEHDDPHVIAYADWCRKEYEAARAACSTSEQRP